MTQELQYAPLNLYENFRDSAQTFPETAIILDENLKAFPELPLETNYQVAHQLVLLRAYQLAACGIQRGDKVIIYKSPSFDTYLLAVAVTFLGAVPVMVSYHLPASTIDVFIDRLSVAYLLYDDVTDPRVEQMTKCDEAHKISLDKLLLVEAIPVEQNFLDLHDIAYMTHTSGTTGIPKLICHSQASMGWRTKWQRTIFAKMVSRELVACHISPVHSRFNIGIASLMSMGFPMMPLTSATKETLRRMLPKYQPIALETHPNNFVRWSHLAVEEPNVFQSLIYYHSTFDAINNETMARFLRASSANTPIFLQVYGQSECGPMILKAHTLDSLKTSDARDMGVGLKGLTKACIADEKGNELPVNTDGHIHFLSKGRALTYFGEDDRFNTTVYGDWWDSGDYGFIDDDGHLHLKDRQVDLIQRVDSNLAIEDALLDQLLFLEEVVIVRDSSGKPQPIISVADNEVMDWEQWWTAVEELPQLNYPIIKAFDDIPRTATMKVQRLQIERELIAGTF
ncbi:acetate--CoA ligase [Vagococcus penaei]|uniref:Acetate--CoA ligase n=1 Tax=Vagococcus penaei TaxID=633807 RepID=A0A1Q2D8J0_9ENTE|nr:acyl-CoA synthetase [Vagococcus penaei]AQP54704.1 acetate--CoA ligase [Vagococcus penaei]RSU05358.1 acetate--CoA ligase [Vagococcus penaei]